MVRVLNKRVHGIPSGACYVGRPTPVGNPFVIGPDGDRLEVIAKYRAWLLSQPDLVRYVQLHLRGADLVCWCAPLPCHADVLAEIANAD
jgi:Domain of unknown function (DUF4326)